MRSYTLLLATPARRATQGGIGCGTHRGFTIVELLVVISIIGVLMSLLLPAINSARETARSTNCKNNLRQLATAAKTYSTAWNGRMPSGGWGHLWIGRPGFLQEKQPGGWIYQLLPYMEEEPLYKAMADNIPQGTKLRIEKVVAGLYCPSRRRAEAYPLLVTGFFEAAPGSTVAGRSDYAANAGANLAGNPVVTELTDNQFPNSFTAANTFNNWPPIAGFPGIVAPRQSFLRGQIEDGEGKVLFAAEKYLDIPRYETGDGAGDRYPALSGYGSSIVRTTDFPPERDQANSTPSNAQSRFGSAHPSGINVTFCDTTTQSLDLSISPQVFKQIGNRSDATIFSDAEIGR
ncbi:MAG: DUF1559 domain-containing protein [Pirellulales bacterium]|nr:DUF1559 domain-containing protein [Pirellulales bacterium]